MHVPDKRFREVKDHSRLIFWDAMMPLGVLDRALGQQIPKNLDEKIAPKSLDDSPFTAGKYGSANLGRYRNQKKALHKRSKYLLYKTLWVPWAALPLTHIVVSYTITALFDFSG